MTNQIYQLLSHRDKLPLVPSLRFFYQDTYTRIMGRPIQHRLEIRLGHSETRAFWLQGRLRRQIELF